MARKIDPLQCFKCGQPFGHVAPVYYVRCLHPVSMFGTQSEAQEPICERCRNRDPGEEFAPPVECAVCGRTVYRTPRAAVKFNWTSSTFELLDTRQPLCSPKCSSDYYNARRPKVEHEPVPCYHCGEVYTPKRSDSKFCSGACRVAEHRELARLGVTDS
jgi:hypothetical protein